MNRAARVFVVLFSMAFLVPGVLIFFLSFVRPVALVYQAKSWEETPCRILSSGVKVIRGNKGSTYQLRAEYTYTYQGGSFHSDRYNFVTGSSSEYKEKDAVVERLPAGQETVCFVNPRAPQEAVIDRRFTWEILFALFSLIFFFVGLGGVTLGIFAGKSERQLRQEWLDGRITAFNKSGITGLWVFTVIFNLVVWPAILVSLLNFVGSWKGPASLVFLFPAIGIGFIALAIHRTLRWQNFGATVFEMETTPGVIGGTLRGKILLGQLVRPEEGCRVKLACIRRYTTGSGKNRQTSEDTLWASVEETGAGSTDSILVAFEIPAECKPTNETNANDKVFWCLEAKVKLPGVDYNAKFEVPVFAAGQRLSANA